MCMYIYIHTLDIIYTYIHCRYLHDKKKNICKKPYELIGFFFIIILVIVLISITLVPSSNIFLLWVISISQHISMLTFVFAVFAIQHLLR